MNGELYVKGPGVFMGYLQEDGSIFRPVTPDGFFATGDGGPLHTAEHSNLG